MLFEEFDFNRSSVELLDLFSDEPYIFFLDSSQTEKQRGRYSFLGFDPFEVFQCTGQETLTHLKKRFEVFACAKTGSSQVTPLKAGVVGCLSYDYGLRQESIQLKAKEESGLPDGLFGFYDCILTLDHYARKLYVASSGLLEKNARMRKLKAVRKLKYVTKKLKGMPPVQSRQTQTLVDTCASCVSNFSYEQYCSAVNKALAYIADGDIYQVNLSQRFECDIKGMRLNPVAMYKALRSLSPSSFGGYFDARDFQLISSSPERFLHLHDKEVHVRPMKGTRPRGKNSERDRQMRAEIINSRKDQAELLMITDLERNDLGKVCEYGSVRVKEMRNIEEYKYVFQATSMIEGVLRENKDVFDLISACFPGGSITGCPKLRAMEIIEELEPTRRGMYTGCLGYISFDGNMDFNILIRTLLVHKEKVYFQVGGGIVADSTPQGEYEETLVKAAAMKACLE